MTAILTYGSEVWLINKAAQNIITATEVRFIWRKMKISYTEMLTNEEQ